MPSQDRLQGNPRVLHSEFAGRYRVDREIGHGGTSIVYRSEDTTTGRVVAIKMLRPELAETLSAARFVREIQRTRALEHPRILPVLDHGEWNGVLYCVFPYMERGSLRDLLRAEPQLEVARVVAIGRQLCEALEFAHQRKLIHRDVKPENILFDGEDAVLADFGIARALESAGESTTSTGVVRGTVAYMSPEQASGQREYDGRSDVFSLGCVLYEALAGMPAYTGPTPQAVLMQRLHHRPHPIGAHRPSIPPAIDAAIERALAIAAADRYRTATEFGEALETALTTGHIAAIDYAAARLRRRRALRRAAIAVPIGTALLAASWQAPVTRPLRSSIAVGSGQSALAAGDFERADSTFARAVQLDPSNVRALIWLATARTWQGQPRTSWTGFVTRAAAQRDTLAAADRLHLEGLAALARDDGSYPCLSWESLTARDSADFTGWLSLARCLERDRAVVAAPGAPVQWAFRSSYERAYQAYRRAFELRPTLLQGFGGRSLPRLLGTMKVSGVSFRPGRAIAPDTTIFAAVPSWRGDTVAFEPYPETIRFRTPRSDAELQGIHEQRHRFLRLATTWRVEIPGSAEAIEAVAVALEMLGDVAALDTLRLARATYTDAVDRERVAALEVITTVKFAAPGDTARLRVAKLLADTLLGAASSSAGDPALLAALAALTGRATDAARLAVVARAQSPVPALAQAGPTLLALAALGGPPDSLLSFERVVEARLRSLPEQARSADREAFVFRAASLAFPNTVLRALTDEAGRRSPASELAAAARRGDHAAMRSLLARRESVRRAFAPSDVTIDGIFEEAAALAAIGDRGAALAWMSPTLASLPQTAALDLADFARTGPLMRLMVLRAELSTAAGDSVDARRWAGAVRILWADADPFLRITVARMANLSRGRMR